MKSKTLTYSRKQEYHHNNNYRSGRNMLENTLPLNCIKIRVGADKSLARRGREKNYSDQTRDLFNIFPTKLNKLLNPLRRTKNGDLSIVFSVRGTGGSPTWPDPENRVGDRHIGSPTRPVSSGLQVPGETHRFRPTTSGSRSG